MKSALTVLYGVVGFSFVLSQSVYAYLDAGTASYIIQCIAGFILVILSSVGVFWRKITGLFMKKRKMDEVDKLDEEEN